MASQQRGNEYKQEHDDLGPSVDDLFVDFLDSDDEQNIKYNSATPGLVHVINGFGSNPSSGANSGPNQMPITIQKVKSKVVITNNNKHNKKSTLQRQTTSTMSMNDIVCSLYDLKTYIKDQSKATEFEHLMHALLTKFDDISLEKFNLLQQIRCLEEENDKLYNKAKGDDDNNNNNNDEFRDIEFTEGLDNEQSVILVDYWNDKKENKEENDDDINNKSSKIPLWTKFYQMHRTGIGEDLRIAIIQSQKIKNINSYNDQYFEETLQSIEVKCYFPRLFKKLREKVYGISLSDFLSSFKHPLLQINQCQSSLSGSQFFYSFDGKYIIKSMRREEVTFIKQMIYKYGSYIEDNKDKSFLSKYIAMFKIVNTANDNIINAQINKVNIKYPQHFMIMDCVYYDDECLLEMDKSLLIYDLKGSKYNRMTEKQNNYQFQFSKNDAAKNKISILKDNEWMDRGLKLSVTDKESKIMRQQLLKDIQFLKSLEIMDYSLLIAVYDDNNNNNNKNSKMKRIKSIKNNRKQKYFIGIIDFLQHYSIYKKMEGNGAYYLLGIDSYDIVDPEHYGNRLWKFVCDFVL